MDRVGLEKSVVFQVDNDIIFITRKNNEKSVTDLHLQIYLTREGFELMTTFT
jgi:hypothetical protein